MESNFSDKELRDKLKGVEFPFEPAAWNQMSSMLDEDKKRRGFIWWWSGGIAACLLLAGFLSYEFLKVEQPNLSSANTNQYITSNPQPTTNVNTNSSTSNSSGALPSETQKEKQENGLNPVNELPRNTAVEKNNSKSNSTPAEKHFKNKRDTETLNTSTSFKNAASQNSNGVQKNQTYTSASNKQSQEQLNATTESNSTTSSMQLVGIMNVSPMLADELSETLASEKIDMEKSDEGVVDLKKLKKSIFKYSLGAIANLTGSTLGGQTYSDKNGTAPIFDSRPSYAVGLNQEFMLWRKISLTNSIMYAQSSYTVYNPKTLNYSTPPLQYSSKLSEIEIPIGLKFYPVSKEKFRFYIEAGVINHIKLKESFAYAAKQDTTVHNFALNGSYYPSTNIFAADPAFISISQPGSRNNVSDFSINKGNRYYTSFYSSAGADFIVRKHIVFFAESLFYMSLQKIGVQDKRKYNLGLSGGLRYQF